MEEIGDRPYLKPIATSNMGSKKRALDVRRGKLKKNDINIKTSWTWTENLVPIPPNRLTPLKEQWQKLYDPIVKQLKLEIRFNSKRKQVELRASKLCGEISSLQKVCLATLYSVIFSKTISHINKRFFPVNEFTNHFSKPELEMSQCLGTIFLPIWIEMYFFLIIIGLYLATD